MSTAPQPGDKYRLRVGVRPNATWRTLTVIAGEPDVAGRIPILYTHDTKGEQTYSTMEVNTLSADWHRLVPRPELFPLSNPPNMYLRLQPRPEPDHGYAYLTDTAQSFRNEPDAIIAVDIETADFTWLSDGRHLTAEERKQLFSPTPPPEPEPANEGPHSRACGWQQHAHGPFCAADCPTCHDLQVV